MTKELFEMLKALEWYHEITIEDSERNDYIEDYKYWGMEIFTETYLRIKERYLASLN